MNDEQKKCDDFSGVFLNALHYKYTGLIRIADRKAGILLGVSFLAISILLARLSETGFNLMLVSALLFALVIVLFSVLSLSPRIIKNTGKYENILFFNTIAALPEEAYQQRMEQMLQSNSAMHDALLLDYYQTCLILKRKYSYLKKCYTACIIACLMSPLLLILFYFV